MHKEAAAKAGEAFLETDLGKRMEKAADLGEDFIATLPGKLITGAAAAGVVTAIVATNSELPAHPLQFLWTSSRRVFPWRSNTRAPY